MSGVFQPQSGGRHGWSRVGLSGEEGGEVRVVREGEMEGDLEVMVRTLVYLLCKMRSQS